MFRYSSSIVPSGETSREKGRYTIPEVVVLVSVNTTGCESDSANAIELEKIITRVQIIDTLSFISFELICVIDGCTDTTETIVKEYMQRDSRVRYLKNDTTRGAAYSRNCGMEEANGTYIAFLDGKSSV